MTATPSSQAEVEKLLPEWEIVQGPMHCTPAFRFPVYASKCRPAVLAALQQRNEKIADLAVLSDKLVNLIATKDTHIVALEEETTRLRTALEPFSKMAEDCSPLHDDSFVRVYMSECRKARAALSHPDNSALMDGGAV